MKSIENNPVNQKYYVLKLLMLKGIWFPLRAPAKILYNIIHCSSQNPLATLTSPVQTKTMLNYSIHLLPPKENRLHSKSMDLVPTCKICLEHLRLLNAPANTQPSRQGFFLMLRA